MNKGKKCVLSLTVIVAMWLVPVVSFSAAPADIPRHVATTPVARTDAEGKERHEETLADPARSSARIVFIGDSITDMWRADDAGKPVWTKYWAGYGAVNLGVAGDRTEHVLWRIEHGALDGMKPRVVVLLIGTNNSGQSREVGSNYRCTAQQTADGINAVLQKIRAKCPYAKILLMGILPRTESEDPSNVQNMETNKIISKFADGTTVRYMDIGKRFVKPENNDPTIMLMPDLLHLNTDGYKIWTEAILPVIKEWLR